MTPGPPSPEPDEHDDERLLDGPSDVPSSAEDGGDDDLADARTTSSRLLALTSRVLALLLAVALAVPAGRWLVDELAFRTSGEAVTEALGSDADLVESLLLVRAVGCGGSVSTGSAFAVDLGEDPVVVTNRHVVDDAGQVSVRQLAGGPVQAVERHLLSASADVAVLELPDDLAVPLPAGGAVTPGDDVRLVGFPAGQPFTADGVVDVADPARLVVDVPTDAGASGSPVLDADGQVVGQVYARTADGRGVATPIARMATAVDDAVPAGPC